MMTREEAIEELERLPNGAIRVNFIEAKENAVSRLAAIEDILGDEYDLDRLRELAEADRKGRCVVLPRLEPVLPRLEPGQGDPPGELGPPGPPGIAG